MRKRATLADFAVDEYEMTAVGPGGVELVYVMRPPSLERRMQIEFELNPRPKPPLYASDPFRKIDGTVYPVYDFQDSVYKKALAEWQERQIQWMIAESLIEPAVEGDTPEEKLAAVADFSLWVKEALMQGLTMLTTVGRDTVKLRPFRRGRSDDQSPAD